MTPQGSDWFCPIKKSPVKNATSGLLSLSGIRAPPGRRGPACPKGVKLVIGTNTKANLPRNTPSAFSATGKPVSRPPNLGRLFTPVGLWRGNTKKPLAPNVIGGIDLKDPFVMWERPRIAPLVIGTFTGGNSRRADPPDAIGVTCPPGLGRRFVLITTVHPGSPWTKPTLGWRAGLVIPRPGPKTGKC